MNECVRDEQIPAPECGGGRNSTGTLSKAKKPASWSECTDAFDTQLPSFSTYTVKNQKRRLWNIYFTDIVPDKYDFFCQVSNKLIKCRKLMVSPGSFMDTVVLLMCKFSTFIAKVLGQTIQEVGKSKSYVNNETGKVQSWVTHMPQ